MVTLTRSVDISGDRITPEALDLMRADGVRVVWQNLWTGDMTEAVTRDNLLTVLTYPERGWFIPCGYLSVTKWNTGRWHVQRAYDNLGSDVWAELALVPVDVELPGIPSGLVRDAVERTVELGKRPALYSSLELWNDLMGGDESFADCLKWTARWIRRWPSVAEFKAEWETHAWGGGGPLVAWQCDSDWIYRYGLRCDVSVVDEEVLVMPLTTEEINRIADDEARIQALEQALAQANLVAGMRAAGEALVELAHRAQWQQLYDTLRAWKLAT